MFGPEDIDKNSLEWLFSAIVRLHKGYMHGFMRAHGFTEVTHPRLLFLIESLERQGQAPAQYALAQMLRVSPASIAVSLRRMEKNGLITRQPDAADSRRNIIRVTEKSRAMLEQCQSQMWQHWAGPFAGFSETEREQLSGFFRRIIANLEALNENKEDTL